MRYSRATLLPLGVSGGEIHSQIPWISTLGLEAGVLADPLSILMTNVVAWISFLIFVYSAGYMHGDRDMTRFWFFMLFFIGSMQLIVLSDNLLMVFFGWEGVGLASYALIGFWYHDRKKDYVGREGERAAGISLWASPTHAGMKAFLMTRAGDTMMLAGMFLIFAYAGTFGFRELIENQQWANQMAQQNLLVPAAVLIFGGAIGKSAQFPLNEWLLEAMTGPTSVSALIHARHDGQSRCLHSCKSRTLILRSGSIWHDSIFRSCCLDRRNHCISTRHSGNSQSRN